MKIVSKFEAFCPLRFASNFNGACCLQQGPGFSHEVHPVRGRERSPAFFLIFGFLWGYSMLIVTAVVESGEK